MMDDKKHRDIDELLKGVLSTNKKSTYYPLNDLFEQRLVYLGITKHQALKILGIDHKTLASFLSGDSKKVDFITILKFADFLEIPHNEIVDKYFQIVTSANNVDLAQSRKRSFIVNNFNLRSLKKIGFIESINDFEHIENRINLFFGFENIFEFSRHKISAAFSSAKRPTNKENLTWWYATARESLERTPNPYEYDRQGLINYFPQIRWHSMEVENGLLLVAQALFKLGITLIIIPKFTSDIHVRAATLPYRNKPCVVLTKYSEFYGTLWFALIHELFHVLYDWEEIQKEEYHITGESNTISINEQEADNFARQYLFSDEKMNAIIPHINEPRFVKYFAEQNHIHSSIIYTFYCWDKNDPNIYARFKKVTAFDFDVLLERFKTLDFLKFTPVNNISKERNLKIYNSI
jgi:HTH-type transcriptional regulator / antitoxin HigA